jgi:hypothetical protein
MIADDTRSTVSTRTIQLTTGEIWGVVFAMMRKYNQRNRNDDRSGD